MSITQGSYITAEDFTNLSGSYAYAEGEFTTASSRNSHAEGMCSLGANGKLYTITAFDDTAKTITLDTVSRLSAGDLLQISRVLNPAIENIPITLINGLAVTLNTTSVIDSSWKCAIKLAETQYPVHAEGYNTTANGSYTHAEGYKAIASGQSSHAEGSGTTASGAISHADGDSTIASGVVSRAEGSGTKAIGYSSHAEGYNTIAGGAISHAEGYSTTAGGDSSHAEGSNTIANGSYSHVEGSNTIAGSYAHVEGRYSLGANGTLYTITACDNTAKTITLDTVSGLSAGDLLQISITGGRALVNIPITLINGLVVTLNTTSAITVLWKYAIKLAAAQYPVHAEGSSTIASGECSHAEGNNAIASGDYAHTEGRSTSANGNSSHAEGYLTKAISDYAHVEGNRSLGANGTLYNITGRDDTAKTITLDTVSGLSVGDLL